MNSRQMEFGYLCGLKRWGLVDFSCMGHWTIFTAHNSYWCGSCISGSRYQGEPCQMLLLFQSQMCLWSPHKKRVLVNWEENHNSSFESWGERLNLSQLEKVTNCEERTTKSTHTLQEMILFLVLGDEHLLLIQKVVMETWWLQQRPFRLLSPHP